MKIYLKVHIQTNIKFLRLFPSSIRVPKSPSLIRVSKFWIIAKRVTITLLIYLIIQITIARCHIRTNKTVRSSNFQKLYFICQPIYIFKEVFF